MTSLPSIGYTKKIELILSTPGRLRVPVDLVASVQRFAPLPSAIDAFPEDAPNQGTRVSGFVSACALRALAS